MYFWHHNPLQPFICSKANSAPVQFTSAIPWTLITNTKFDFTFIFTFRRLLSTTYLKVIGSLRAFTIDGMFLVMVQLYLLFFMCLALSIYSHRPVQIQ